MKTCTLCKLLKSLSDFYLDKGKPASRCKKCVYASREEYRRVHKHESATYAKAYFELHKSKLLQRASNWYSTHRSRAVASRKLWAIANPESVKLFRNAGNHRRRESLRHTDGTSYISAALLKRTMERNSGICIYCLSAKAISCDHFIPLKLGGRTVDWNLLPSCLSCNSRKNATAPEQWVPVNSKEPSKVWQLFFELAPISANKREEVFIAA